MARFITSPVTVLGVRVDGYDFVDSEGKRVQGQNHVVAVFDPVEVSSYDLKIHSAHAEVIPQLAEGLVTRLAVDVQARGNRLDQRIVGLLD